MEWDTDKIREIWDGLAAAWDANRALLWSWTGPVSEDLIAKLDPRPGQTIVEVGAGPGDTGFVIAPILEPGGRLVCTDLSPEMLERARAAADRLGLTNVDYRVTDVMTLDLPDASADGIVGRFVYHLVPDPQKAFAEARRVIRDGGTLAYTVFGPAEEMAFDTALGITMQKLDLTLPEGTSFNVEMNTPASVTEMTTAGGFTDVEVSEVAFGLRFTDGEHLWGYLTTMYGRQAALINSLEPARREGYRAALFEEIEGFRAGDGYWFPALCLNVKAS